MQIRCLAGQHKLLSQQLVRGARASSYDDSSHACAPCQRSLTDAHQSTCVCFHCHYLYCLVCRVLADFMRSFGGEAMTQAAWQLTGLPHLLPCPALTGTELDPHAALHTLPRPNTSQNSTTADTVVIPQEVQSDLVRQAAEGEANAAVAPADPRQRQLDRTDSRPASGASQGTNNSQSDATDNLAESGPAGQHETPVGGLVGPGWVQQLLGADSEPLQEPQLMCIVQGLRLLVTLLRERHTWEPVSGCHSLTYCIGSTSTLVAGRVLSTT